MSRMFALLFIRFDTVSISLSRAGALCLYPTPMLPAAWARHASHLWIPRLPIRLTHFWFKHFVFVRLSVHPSSWSIYPNTLNNQTSSHSFHLALSLSLSLSRSLARSFSPCLLRSVVCCHIKSEYMYMFVCKWISVRDSSFKMLTNTIYAYRCTFASTSSHRVISHHAVIWLGVVHIRDCLVDTPPNLWQTFKIMFLNRQASEGHRWFE